MSRVYIAALAVIVAAAVGCSDDKSTTPTTGNKTLRATIAGTAWNGSLAVQGSRVGNVLAISGTDGSYQLAITIPSVAATGTYNFGPGNVGVAQVVQVSAGASTWTSSLVGGSGSLVLTTFTATRAAGTFSFVGAASPGTPATGTRAVTGGSFDITF